MAGPRTISCEFMQPATLAPERLGLYIPEEPAAAPTAGVTGDCSEMAGDGGARPPMLEGVPDETMGREGSKSLSCSLRDLELARDDLPAGEPPAWPAPEPAAEALEVLPLLDFPLLRFLGREALCFLRFDALITSLIPSIALCITVVRLETTLTGV